MLTRLAPPSFVQIRAMPLTTFNEIKPHLMSLGTNLGGKLRADNEIH